MDALGAAEVEKSFVDRQRFDQRGQRLHGMTDLAANADILCHVRRDHGGGGAQRQRLEHRHRGANAVGSGDVARGRYHAAFAATDDDGLIRQSGIVAFLDGGIERVAVDVRQRQRGEGTVADEAWRAAVAASARRERLIAETVPAEAERTGILSRTVGHGTSRSQRGSPSASCAAAMVVG